MAKIDIDLLLKELEAKNVVRQQHPTLPLWIYKYTQSTVYDKKWNETNLRCRGLVVDEHGNIVSNVMPKFFNDFESTAPGMSGLIAPRKDGIIKTTEKLDGSLITVSWWNENLVVSSSGSFKSPQAFKARKIIEENNYTFDKGKTYLFEVIYPENRIVLNYGDMERLVLITKRDTQTGVEESIDDETKFYKVPVVAKSLEELIAEKARPDFINKEGFVVQYDNGSRLKVKYDKYMEIHKLISGVNEKYIWEIVKDNIDIMDLVNRMPDHIQAFVKPYMVELRNKYQALEIACMAEYDRIVESLPKGFNRKQFAVIAAQSSNASVMFLMLDGKSYEQAIWNKIRPMATKTFGIGEDWEA